MAVHNCSLRDSQIKLYKKKINKVYRGKYISITIGNIYSKSF